MTNSNFDKNGFDIAWPEEPKEELKESTEEKEEIKISSNWLVQTDYPKRFLSKFKILI